MTTSDIEINLAKVKDIALKGVRRSALFLGLGINAAKDSRLQRYQLAELTGIELLPATVSEETLADFKEEFELWVVECGLRELIERFALFLDEIHKSCTIIAVSRGEMKADDGEKWQRSFTHKGIEDKLKKLKSRFKIAPDHPEYLNSINQARNCMTHRCGRVGPEDCRGEAEFTMTWQSFDLLAKEPHKTDPTPLPMPSEDPVLFKQGASIYLRITERKVATKLGEVIRLSPRQLAEICHFLIIATDQVVKGAAEYAASLGALKQTQPAGGADG